MLSGGITYWPRDSRTSDQFVARGISPAAAWGFYGEPRVNVLGFNLALRRAYPRDDLNHSLSFDHRRRPKTLRTAIAMALRWPTSTTSRLPRVTPVYRRFRCSIA
jgi:hypothetical protein